MIDAAVRNLVRQRAGERCEYSRLPENAIHIPFHAEHIIAKQHGGNDDPSNLCLACDRCNLLVVGGREDASKGRLHSEEVEVVAGHKFGGHGFCARYGQHGDPAQSVESEKSIKWQVGRRLKVAQEGVRERMARFGNLNGRSGDRDDLIGVADRQQIENHLLHETKDCYHRGVELVNRASSRVTPDVALYGPGRRMLLPPNVAALTEGRDGRN